MVNFIIKTRFFNRSHRITAAYNGISTGRSHSLCHRLGANSKSIYFKHAHRPVPNYSFGISYSLLIQFYRFWSNIQCHFIGRHSVHRYRLSSFRLLNGSSHC